MKIKLKTIKAMTLAEVLITLSIIGVIAALVIPNLNADIRKEEYVTGLKKFYTEHSQVFKLMAQDYGCPNNLACTNVFDAANGHWNVTHNALAEMVKYLNVKKACIDTSNSNCGVGSWTYLNNNGSGTSNGAAAMLTTGEIVIINDWGTGNCNSASITKGPQGHVCGTLQVDINGTKGPNIMGRDFFSFVITNEGDLYPEGGTLYWDSDQYWNGTDPDNHCDFQGKGHKCAGRIIEEGWQMNY